MDPSMLPKCRKTASFLPQEYKKYKNCSNSLKNGPILIFFFLNALFFDEEYDEIITEDAHSVALTISAKIRYREN